MQCVRKPKGISHESWSGTYLCTAYLSLYHTRADARGQLKLPGVRLGRARKLFRYIEQSQSVSVSMVLLYHVDHSPVSGFAQSCQRELGMHPNVVMITLERTLIKHACKLLNLIIIILRRLTSLRFYP